MKKGYYLNKLTLMYMKDFHTLVNILPDTNTEVNEKVKKLFIIF